LVEILANLPRAEADAGVQRGAAAGPDAIDHRLQLFAMTRSADALGWDEQLGFVVEDDERENVVIRELIHGDACALACLFDFRALHRAAAIEDQREIHRHAMAALRLARFDLDLDDDFAWAARIDEIALRQHAQTYLRFGGGNDLARKHASQHEKWE